MHRILQCASHSAMHSRLLMRGLTLYLNIMTQPMPIICLGKNIFLATALSRTDCCVRILLHYAFNSLPADCANIVPGISSTLGRI